MYQIVPTEVCVGREWVWDGWFTGHYEDVYATKNILSKAEPFTKTVEFTETQLATLNKEGKISANISKNIIEIDLNDEAVRKAMKCQWRAGGNEFSIDKKMDGETGIHKILPDLLMQILIQAKLVL